jgi:nucleoside-diphosphate-sugar epimerase
VLIKNKDFFFKDIDSILKSTRYCWINARKKNFFFTGCTGFFGIWLLKVFSEANKKFKLNSNFYVLTRNKKIKKTFFYKIINNNKIKFIYGDVRSFEFLKLPKIDFIIHGATTSAVETYNKQNYKTKYSIIVDGTLNMINFSNKCNCKNFFYMSSGAVYGYKKNKYKFSENFKIRNTRKKIENDITVLGEAKLKAENLVKDNFKTKKGNYFIARLFSFVGPFMPLKIHYAIGNFLFNSILKKNIFLNSSGKSMRTYMYIKDCIIWIIMGIFLKKNIANKVFNIGGNDKISILSLAKKIAKLNDKNLKVIINKRNNQFNHYMPNINKFRKVFKPPKILDLNNSLKITRDHIQNNLEFYKKLNNNFNLINEQ